MEQVTTILGAILPISPSFLVWSYSYIFLHNHMIADLWLSWIKNEWHAECLHQLVSHFDTMARYINYVSIPDARRLHM